jgi:hypothetical protein
MPRARPGPACTLLVGLLVFAACASTRSGGGALEPRFVAVHNALAAMGLAQVGPIQQGSLAEGQAVRVTLQLPAGCVTVAAIGGDAMHDVDATLLDPRGSSVAHDTTNEPQAVLRTCVETADAYVLVVKAASGAGSWIVAAWAGGLPSSGAPAQATLEPSGTCEAPIPLGAGSVSASTSRGEHDNAGSCSPSDSRELVYRLEVPRRQRVTIEVEAHFDSVLYVRKEDCGDANAEVDCNDDGPDRTHSRIERVLDPGTYFVFVDGYGQESGTFKMNVTMADVLALADMCRKAPSLPNGVTQTATTVGLADDAQATCGNGAQGADAAWRAEIPSRSRVRIVEHSDEVAPIVHVRRACSDAQSELACGESGAVAGDAAVTGVFDAGGYTVVADARERDSAGRYTLLLDTSPLAGSGVRGDGCGDAAPLGTVSAGASGSVAGDTFAARDDVAGTCGGAGAPDVVYRFEVPRRSRFVASLDGEEAPHVVVVWHHCGDRATEVVCARAVDEVLAPGTYYIGVDGASADAFGRFSLGWALRDLTGQGAACAAATTLVDGRPFTATTVGAADKFVTSCGVADPSQSGPDRVFRMVLSTRATVRVDVTATSFDATVAVRRACADGSAGSGDVELACESDADAAHRTSLERSLEAGTYWIVVDGQSPNDRGAFTVEYRVLR